MKHYWNAIVISNRGKAEPYTTNFNDAFETLIVENLANLGLFGWHKNDETNDHLNNKLCSSGVETNEIETKVWRYLERVSNSIFTDNLIHKNIRSLSNK